MTSTGEDTRPSTEMIADVCPPGENSGPLSQINDPPGQDLNIQAAFVKLSADFGKLTTHLGRICEYLPIPDARENRDLPGSGTKGRKRRHSVSSSDSEDDSSTRHKTSKDDVDAISVTASEEDVNALLCNSSTPGATTDAQTDVNDELLTELSAGLIDDEKKGPKITEQLAAIVNKRWAKKLASEKITSILEKYSQPENCSEVTVTRVNPEIWAPLNAAQRKADLRMANLQQALQKATFATVMTTDKLLGMKNDPQNTSLQFNELITNNVDVVALLGHAAHELSHLRREKLKPALKPAYHALCSSETITASTKYLFGDDLAKQIRDTKETNRIGNAVGSSKHDYRPIHRDSSWPNRRNTAYKSGPANRQHFLGKGPHSTVRKKYDNSQKKGQKK